MIRLSAANYHLEGVSPDFFWQELDKITVGQLIDPEFGYTTPFFGNLDNVFGGRKTGNTFSVFLYRPITQVVRTEILAKGAVAAQGSGIMVKCSFEYPFWSLLMFLFVWAVIFALFYPVPFANGLMAGLVGTGLYCLLVAYNHANLKSEMSRQLESIEEKARR